MLPSPVPSPHAPRALRRRMAALVRTQADHLTAPYQQGHLGGRVALLRTGSALNFLVAADEKLLQMRVFGGAD